MPIFLALSAGRKSVPNGKGAAAISFPTIVG